MLFPISFLTIIGVTAGLVKAQTYTACDPLNTTCSPSAGLDSYTYTADFTGSDAASLFSSSWTAAEGTNVTFGDKGMVFSISDKSQAPTVTSNFAFLFGRVDVVMQAAPGTGIVSSIVFESIDLDEIDWEALGGNTTSIETNYFGKGNTTTYDRATYVAVVSPQTVMHTYSIEWTSLAITWSIDNQTVRTLEYSDANDGSNFPQTPLQIKLGNWDGGDSSSEGTAEWAGGKPDWSQAPYNMYIKSVSVINYTPASYYNWTDHSGSWQSIMAYNASSGQTSGISTASNSTLNNGTSPSPSSPSGSSSSGSASGTTPGNGTVVSGTPVPSSGSPASSSGAGRTEMTLAVLINLVGMALGFAMLM